MKEKVIDPVTRFEIPQEWIDRLSDPGALERVKSGMWILLSNGKLLKRGFTTGTTSAAACKGAIMSLANPAIERIRQVDVPTPAGIRVSVPVTVSAGSCSAVKIGGDHQSDITDGVEFLAKACESEIIELIARDGIGRIRGRGPSASQNKAAISQSALSQIMLAMNEGLELAGLKGASVVLCAHGGREIAALTLNPKMGVEGGISILGSTGFVEPWNEHLSVCRANQLKEKGKVLATTGRIGLKYSRVLFPDHEAVLIGSQLGKIEFREDQDSILLGLPALILKWGWPGILEGTPYGTVAEMVERDPDHPNISMALEKVQRRLPFTRIILLHRDGKIFRDAGKRGA